MSTTSKESTVPAIAVAQLEGEYVEHKTFSDAEMLDFIARHTTLHKKVDFLYVVDGYEAKVTWDDNDLSPTYKGDTLKDALIALMQNGDVKSSTGR